MCKRNAVRMLTCEDPLHQNGVHGEGKDRSSSDDEESQDCEVV